MPRKLDETKIIGRWVRVISCAAHKHGSSGECVCSLIGKRVYVTRRKRTTDTEVASYHLFGTKQCVQRKQVRLSLKQPGVIERILFTAKLIIKWR